VAPCLLAALFAACSATVSGEGVSEPAEERSRGEAGDEHPRGPEPDAGGRGAARDEPHRRAGRGAQPPGPAPDAEEPSADRAEPPPGPASDAEGRAAERVEPRLDLARRIGQQVTEPTQTLMQFRLRYEWNAGFHRLEEAVPDAVRDDQHGLILRATVPFDLYGLINVLRLDVPYQLLTPTDEEGVNQVVLLDLLVFQLDWGRVGVGPVMTLLPLREDAAFAGGPAVGFVTVLGPWLLGALNQNLFGEETALSLLRPVLAVTPLDWLTISLAQSDFVWDWRALHWTSLPLGLRANAVARFAGRAMVFGVGGSYDFRELPGTPQWTIRVDLSLVVPGAYVPEL
jgi:hypothetical protein